MKISEAWLRELVDPPGGRDELVQRLTMAGLKIESVEPVAGALLGAPELGGDQRRRRA